MSTELNQVLTFSVGASRYAIDIAAVREIRGWSPVTAIPEANAQMVGMLNLRGVVVPVFDLRVRFGVDASGDILQTAVIVVSLPCTAGESLCGLVVDGVSDVTTVKADQLRPVSTMKGTDTPDYIRGLLVHDAERSSLLLDTALLIGVEVADDVQCPPAPSMRHEAELSALNA